MSHFKNTGHNWDHLVLLARATELATKLGHQTSLIKGKSSNYVISLIWQTSVKIIL